MPDYNWGQGLRGAGGGALAGWSVGGPLGAGIGAGLGLLGGFGGGPSAEQQAANNQLNAYYQELQRRGTPQAQGEYSALYSGFRQNQSDLINRLEALSQGKGPSLAAQQFRQATDQNMAAQQAMAASGRGGNMAAFNAANNMGMLGAQAAQGSALARTNEQMQAFGQLGQNINAGRQADEGINTFNAGQHNSVMLANLDARLRSMNMNDQARLNILSQLSGNANAQANQPGLGDQILAGGAGMYAAYAGQKGNQMGGGSSIPSNYMRPVNFGSGGIPAGYTRPINWGGYQGYGLPGENPYGY